MLRKEKSPRWRGRHRQHASRVRTPDISTRLLCLSALTSFEFNETPHMHSQFSFADRTRLFALLAAMQIAAIAVAAQNSSPVPSANPFLVESALPYHLPPFDKIKDEHFIPATEAGMKCRSEEHTSELQSHVNLVCRLLLEKKNKSPTQ